MPLVIPDGFAQVTFFMSGAGAPTGAACTLGVYNPGDDNASQIAANVGGAWEDNIMPEICNDITFTSCRAKRGPTETGAFADVAFSTAGTLAGACVAPNLAILVTLETSLGGRRGRGRFYVPGAQESDVDEAGNLSNTRVGLMNAALAGFQGDILTAGYGVVVLHSDGKSALPSPTSVDQFSTATLMATQRRRMRR